MTEHAPETPPTLRGKVAVVTGAGRGIGRAIALAYAQAGAAVACSARSDEGIAETVRAITQAGGTASACVADVVDLAAVQALFAHAASGRSRPASGSRSRTMSCRWRCSWPRSPRSARRPRASA